MAPIGRDGVSLYLASFLALFLELAFIRWIPANVLSAEGSLSLRPA